MSELDWQRLFEKQLETLQRIEKRLDALEGRSAGETTRNGPALAAEAKGGGPALPPEEWAKVRARWPAMPDHPLSKKAYQNHVASVGKEYSMHEIQALAKELESNQHYVAADFIAEGYPKHEAQALVFFLKSSGLCVWRDKKGLIKVPSP